MLGEKQSHKTTDPTLYQIDVRLDDRMGKGRGPGPFVLGLVFWMAFWLIDTLLRAFVFKSGHGFLELLCGTAGGVVIYSRVCIMILLGVVVAARECMVKHKRLEKELEKMARWFSTTMKSISAAVITTDDQGDIMFLNSAAQTLLGTNDQAVGRPIHEFCKLRSAGKAIHFKALLEKARESIVQLPENVMLERNEGLVHVAGGVSAICGADGELYGSVIAIQDLSLFHQMDNSHAMLSMAVHQAADAILIVSKDGLIAYANPAVGQVIGIPSDELVGKPARNMRSLLSSTNEVKALVESAERKKEWRGELALRGSDGRPMRFQTAMSPITDVNGEITSYVAVARDVSREEGLHQELVQSQKMEVLGVLVSGVAHDFNNLLMVVLNFSEMLELELTEESRSWRHAKAIHDAGRRGTGLTRQLLSFARCHEVVEKQIIELNQVLTEMKMMLRRLLPEDIELEIATCDNPLFVKADPGQMEQVIMNLVINARDALSDGGEIKIWTDVEEGSHSLHKAIIHVSDNGPGMEPEVREQAFAPFFTTKPEGKGTGLGLSTVKRIMDNHGGRVDITTASGKGCTFSLRLPLCGSETLEIHQDSLPKRSSLMGTETVLLVEDDPVLLKMIRDLLKRHGCHVYAVSGGTAGLEMAKKHASEIDIVVTDIVMPDMSGVELSKALRGLEKPLERVILMTGYLDCEGLDEMLRLRDVVLLRKPFTLPQLVEKMRILLY